jgi:polyisoprenyl-phosphate glycosyltransferase
MGESATKKRITILCPVFNEEAAIPIFYDRLSKSVAPLRDKYTIELIFTNNASSDRSLEVIRQIHGTDSSVQAITLSRNFGYQASLLCGLHHARGDAIVIIDVDCEDPPEMIPEFVAGWESGHDIVYGRRDKRPESVFTQLARKTFYRLTRLIADYDFILDMAEFSLFTSRVRDEVVKNRSTFPFIRTELGFVGFRRHGISYTRQTRVQGKTHYNYVRMTQFAIGGILSSSTFLLRLAVYVGLPLALANLVALIVGCFVPNLPGLPQIYLLDATYGIAVLSILSTYLARVHKDGIQRPLFIVDWDNSLFDKT